MVGVVFATGGRGKCLLLVVGVVFATSGRGSVCYWW